MPGISVARATDLHKSTYFACLLQGGSVTQGKGKKNNLEEPKISSKRGGQQEFKKLLVTIFLLQVDLQTQIEVLDFSSVDQYIPTHLLAGSEL